MNSSKFTFDFGSNNSQPTFHGAPAPDNALCELCEDMVKQSKIIRSAPKWEHPTTDDDHAEVTIIEEPQYAHRSAPKVEVFDHYNTLGALRASAKQCHLCALLGAYDPDFPELVDDSSNDIRYTMKVLRADLHADGPGLLKVDLRRGKETGATYLMHGRPKRTNRTTLVAGRTDDFKVLSLARDWLNKCIHEHDGCSRRSHPTADWHLPTRLVKVSGFMTNVFSMKLCLGKDLPAGTKYLTLSHCWGGVDIIKLTADNLQSFQSNIPLEGMPRNFRDAAAVTLFMGYEYLWIDSLCIIQGSVDDWDREAALMGNVYRYCVLNIAATAATNPHDGFFVDRNSHSFTKCQLIPTVRGRGGVYAENWRDRAGKEILNSRGWVCQETALAPRTLYFKSMMTGWKCTMASAQENDADLSTWSQTSDIKRDFYELLDKAKNGDYDSWFGKWWKIISTYTNCNLTFDSDRWPAIMGLATAVEHQSGHRLINGLWESNLASELTWRASSPSKAKRLSDGFPSWSWLSLTAPVSKMGYNLKKHFAISAAVSLQTHPPNNNRLFIRARMAKIKWAVKYYGDGHFEYCYRFLAPTRDVNGNWDGRWDPDTSPNEAWDIWCLEFITDAKLKEAAGLVVKREKKDTGDVWTRVGAYALQPYASYGDSPAWDCLKMDTITLE
ncbi:heterokaryon incompatibility protein-domain-containing protein [Xylariaceae sp. FL1272]|nr:heterokaryon incompatibility protein-domain-containing protein [Xylariaceae sp. FL1272]